MGPLLDFLAYELLREGQQRVKGRGAAGREVTSSSSPVHDLLTRLEGEVGEVGEVDFGDTDAVGLKLCGGDTDWYVVLSTIPT